MAFASGILRRPHQARVVTPAPQGAEPMEKEATTDLMTAGTEDPDWWSYSSEFPRWHVWRGIAGLLYARRLMSSPPRVVRGHDPVQLRDLIRQTELQLADRWK